METKNLYKLSSKQLTNLIKTTNDYKFLILVICSDLDWKYKNRAIKNKAMNNEALKRLFRYCERNMNVKNTDEILSLCFSSPYIEPSFCESIAQHHNAEIRHKIAQCPKLANTTIEKLSHDNHSKIRMGVALNPKTPIHILQRLATDDWTVRWFVAVNENINYELINQLSNDEEDIVRMAIAKNKKTPANILQKLLNDKHEKVRAFASENPNNNVFKAENILDVLKQTKESKNL